MHHIFKKYEESAFYLILIQPIFYSALSLTKLTDQTRSSTLFSTFLFAIVSALVVSSATPSVIEITSEHVDLFGIANTGFQRYFYTIFTLTTFGVFLVQGVVGWRLPNIRFEDLNPSFILLLQTVFALVFLYLLLRFIVRHDDTLIYAFLGFFFCFALICGRTKTFVFWALITLASALFVFLFILPLFSQNVLGSGLVWAFDHHWTGVIGSGLLRGTALSGNAQNETSYGVLLNLLVSNAALISTEGPLRGGLKLLQAINLVFGLLIFLIIFQRLGKKNVGFWFLAFATIVWIFAPVISGFTNNIITPNLLPIRFMCIPVAISIAFYLPRLPLPVGWLVVGMTSAIAIFYNLEMGLICTLGLGFGVFIQTMRFRLAMLTICFCVFIVSFSASFFVLQMLLVEPTTQVQSNDASGVSIDLLKLFGSGYGGLEYYIYVPLVVVLGHCFYLFAGWLQNIRETSTLSGHELQSAVIVGLIISFMPYVMNRFSITNMWVPFLLYFLLVAPLVFSESLKKSAIWLFITLILVLPYPFGYPLVWGENIDDNWTLESEAGCISGFVLSTELCDYIENKSTAFNDYGNGEEAIWISALPLTMLLKTEQRPFSSKLDPFAYSRTPTEHNEMVMELQSQRLNTVLLDNPDNGKLTGIPLQVTNWQVRLAEEAGFRIVEKTPYWIVAQRVPKPN